jgi:hypothetical protein
MTTATTATKETDRAIKSRDSSAKCLLKITNDLTINELELICIN